MTWMQDAMDSLQAVFTEAGRKTAAVLLAALEELSEDRDLERVEVARWESEGGAL